MISAEPHPQEFRRQQALQRLEILDSEAEPAFDDLTALASAICGTPISLISLLDDHRQWFKSRVGLDATETDKNLAFCAHAILQEGVFEVADTLLDVRFSDNPLVTGHPDIRFYAGAPLTSSEGLPLGTLCVIDTVPRQLLPEQARALQILARQVTSQLELRLKNRQLARMNREREQVIAMIGHDLRSPFNAILGFSRRLSQKVGQLPSAEVATMAERILAGSLQVYQLLDELLQWSQQQLSLPGPVQPHCRVLPLVEDTVGLLEYAASVKQLQIAIAVAPDLELSVTPSVFKTIIRNLLHNAIKFTPEQGQIRISSHTDHAQVYLEVADNGLGMDASLKSQLLAGTALSHAGTGGEAGHGLGMRMCLEFVRQQGGVLTIEDNEPQGSRFILCFPRVA